VRRLALPLFALVRLGKTASKKIRVIYLNSCLSYLKSLIFNALLLLNYTKNMALRKNYTEKRAKTGFLGLSGEVSNAG
jgi:hypothetical protein